VTTRRTATITKLEAQKRNPRRVSIYLDGSFALGMDDDLAGQLGLHQGQTLTPEELERIVRAEDKNRARNYALEFLGYRARSVREVRERLNRRGYPGEMVENIIEELQQSGLLDDEDFASRWARGRMNTKPLGERLLRQELRLKGVPEEIIERTLERTFREISQEELAVGMLRARQMRSRGLDQAKAKRRMADFLLRRGFDRQTAWEAVRRVIEKPEADE
jgi:regulatory protein